MEQRPYQAGFQMEDAELKTGAEEFDQGKASCDQREHGGEMGYRLHAGSLEGKGFLIILLQGLFFLT